jgi:hypothetical protein
MRIKVLLSSLIKFEWIKGLEILLGSKALDVIFLSRSVHGKITMIEEVFEVVLDKFKNT